ncbi:protein BRANCHLESS TRICHOME-like [Phalaenopsis equestris]|uniref:protein BRANCHLESS TRICHOME-like n=1 Tax=Phalaenopsis equestris TaxID=78828 RepID=UPI0009E50C52|nr:protein BRANCHLESS TRICHOME-like [Phalaenopsis equestris]
MDDLPLALAEISDLRAELDRERRMRRAAESLAKSLARELADERRTRADAEAETARCREAADRAVREADDDRRMLKLAEAWREERVKMKLAHAAILLEERMREVSGNGMQKTGEVDCVVAGRQGREREGREAENPHIRRGMNGFVEFSRAFKVPSPGLGRDRFRGGAGGLECEKAQLRVLMK